jgi:hypothetical protein
VYFTVAEKFAQKVSKALLEAELRGICRQMKNSQEMNSSLAVIPASKARQESF